MSRSEPMTAIETLIEKLLAPHPPGQAQRAMRKAASVISHGQALRDVVEAISKQEGSADTIRAALRLLVRAYDEGCKE
jgi:hypothetical protein